MSDINKVDHLPNIIKERHVPFLANLNVDTLDIKHDWFTKAVDSGTIEKGAWVVEGYASTSDLDSQKHIVAPEALVQAAESLVKYNTLLFNHDMDRPIGRIIYAEAQEGKLFVRAIISKSEPQLWSKVKDGTLSKFSIFGEILDADTIEYNGSEVLLIKGLTLFETSLVSVPANAEAKTLTWYVSKAIANQTEHTDLILKLVKRYNLTHTHILKSEGGTSVDLTQVISNLEAEIAKASGEAKEQLEANLRSLKALHTTKEMPKDDKKAKDDEEDEDDMKKKKEDMKKNVPSAEAIASVLSAVKSLPDSLKLSADDLEQLDKVVAWLQSLETNNLSEKSVKKSVSTDGGVFQQAIDEMKEIAKTVVDAAKQATEAVSQINTTKKELETVSLEIKKTVDAIPVRKGQDPNSQKDDRSTPADNNVSKIDELKLAVGEEAFNNMDAPTRMRAYIQHTLEKSVNSKLKQAATE